MSRVHIHINCSSGNLTTTMLITSSACFDLFSESSSCRGSIMTMSQSETSPSRRVGGGGAGAADEGLQSNSTDDPNQINRAKPPAQSQFEEQQRQELESRLNELRAKCRLQAEQLMAWRKAYAIEVRVRIDDCNVLH